MFLVCGEMLWDLFAMEGEAGLSFDARIGGSPFNVAMGLSRLGHDSALLTGISEDSLGARLRAAVIREGVDARYLIATTRPSTLSIVDLDKDGGPAYAFYGDNAADRDVRLENLPELTPDVWGVHVGSYSLVVEPVGASLLALVEREAGRRLITLDPNVRPTVESDLDLWRDRISAFASHADLVKVSDEDLDLLYPGVDVAELAENLLKLGPALVIVTKGGEGAEAFGQMGRVSVPGARVAIADTVGAGDTFHAALVTGLAERDFRSGALLREADSDDVAELLKFAIRASAITCSRRGADLPRRADVDAFQLELN